MSGDTSFAGNNPLAVEFNRVDLNNSDWIYIHNSSINHNISRLLKDGLGKTYLGSWTSLRRSISRWILANTWSRGQAFSIPMSWQWFANSFIFCRALMTITSMQFDITENNLWRNIWEEVHDTLCITMRLCTPTLNDKPEIKSKYQPSGSTNIRQYFCITVRW